MEGEKTKTLLPKAGEVGEAPPSMAASVTGKGVPPVPEPPPDPLDGLPDALPVEGFAPEALPTAPAAPVAPVPETPPVAALPEGMLDPLAAPAPPTPAEAPVELPVLDPPELEAADPLGVEEPQPKRPTQRT